MIGRFRLPLAIALPMLALDQLSKIAVLKSIGLHETRPVIPGFFDLVHVYNTGAAFGMFRDNNLFFVLLASVATVVILVLVWRGSFDARILQVAAGLLLGGVLGNLVDRLAYGHVIDFLSFQLGSYTWPAFNVADSCICVAAGLMILQSFLPDKQTPSPQSS